VLLHDASIDVRKLRESNISALNGTAKTKRGDLDEDLEEMENVDDVRWNFQLRRRLMHCEDSTETDIDAKTRSAESTQARRMLKGAARAAAQTLTSFSLF
jgi:hypothetical protein